MKKWDNNFEINQEILNSNVQMFEYSNVQLLFI